MVLHVKLFIFILHGVSRGKYAHGQHVSISSLKLKKFMLVYL